MKNDEEIARELRRLAYCRERLRAPYSRFGDDHRLAMAAQIHVLENRMTLDQVHERYDKHEDSGGEYSEYEFTEALYAHDWMRNLLDEDSPPCGPTGWLSLVDTPLHAGLPA